MLAVKDSLTVPLREKWKIRNALVHPKGRRYKSGARSMRAFEDRPGYPVKREVKRYCDGLASPSREQ
jgi:hypothetical protein